MTIWYSYLRSYKDCNDRSTPIEWQESTRLQMLVFCIYRKSTFPLDMLTCFEVVRTQDVGKLSGFFNKELLMKKIPLILIILSLSFFSCLSSEVKGECIQGNCDSGYGVLIFDDGRVYEGQWKKGLFDGIGQLSFSSGSEYKGEFKKGFMHGYGQITLSDGSNHKCSFKNDKIESNDLIKDLWVKDTTTKVDEHISYCRMGDIFRHYKIYDKAMIYYDKSLTINDGYQLAITNKNVLERKLAERDSKSDKTPKITLHGTPGVKSGTHSRDWIEQERKVSERLNDKFTSSEDIDSKESKILANQKADHLRSGSDKNYGSGPNNPDVEVLSHSKKLVERGQKYSYYSWKVELRNNSDVPKKVYVEYKLLDANGFELEMSNAFIKVRANSTRRYSEKVIIKSIVWRRVKQSEVKISARD